MCHCWRSRWVRNNSSPCVTVAPGGRVRVGIIRMVVAQSRTRCCCREDQPPQRVMSVLRFLLILMGVYRKVGHGIVNLDTIRTREYTDYPLFDRDMALRNAQKDAVRASRAEVSGSWRLARLWWCRAASRHLVMSDEFVFYLMLAEKAANHGKDPSGGK